MDARCIINLVFTVSKAFFARLKKSVALTCGCGYLNRGNLFPYVCPGTHGNQKWSEDLLHELRWNECVHLGENSDGRRHSFRPLFFIFRLLFPIQHKHMTALEFSAKLFFGGQDQAVF